MKVELEGWEKRKVGLEKEIDSLKDYLATLPPQLEEMLNTTAQVQEYLGLKLVHRKTQSDMMAWLPQQLYNVYSQVKWSDALNILYYIKVLVVKCSFYLVI